MNRFAALIVLPLLLAAPAAAFAASDQNGASPSPNDSVQTDQAANANKRQELRQTLEQSGFKDIHIRAEAYAVSANAPDGSPVLMVVSPKGIEVIKHSGGGQDQQGGGENGQQGGGQQGQPGNQPGDQSNSAKSPL